MIDSSRLTLRPLTTDDVGADYVRWMNDPDVVRFLEVRHDPAQTPDDVKAFVSACAGDPDTDLFGAFRKIDGAHIGNIKLGPIHRHYGTSEIGLLIGDPAARGQGFGAEMIKSVAEFAFGKLALRKLTAGCYEANLGSLRAFLNSGFVVEGFRPGEVVFEGAPHGLFLMGRLNGAARG